MAKKSYYFSHDYNARSDPKLQAVQMEHGLAGIGAYWCIVEMIYEQQGYLNVDAKAIAFTLRCDKELINSLLSDFDLFDFDKKRGWFSKTALERIDKRTKVSENRSVAKARYWAERKGAMTTVTTANEVTKPKETQAVTVERLDEKTIETKIENIRKAIYNNSLSSTINACKALDITQIELIECAEKVFSEWLAVGDNDVSFRHLINHIRIKLTNEQKVKGNKIAQQDWETKLIADARNEVGMILMQAENNGITNYK